MVEEYVKRVSVLEDVVVEYNPGCCVSETLLMLLLLLCKESWQELEEFRKL